MKDYMVGFYGGEENAEYGYKPEAGQNLYGTTWYYEGLGNSDKVGDSDVSAYTFVPGTSGKSAKTSKNANQYLKYWDLGKPFTYFYAYEPYEAVTSLKVVGTGDEMRTVLSFPNLTLDQLNANNASDAMFAAAKCDNKDYVDNSKKVDLNFERVNGAIRLAFYETIKGYKVYLMDYSTTKPGIIAYPADEPEEGKTEYREGKYVVAGTPEVEFNDAVFDKVTYANNTYNAEGQYIECPYNWFNTKADFTGTYITDGKVGDSFDNIIYGPTYKVLPADENTTGMTLNVSFKLVSEDTGEVTYVRGAKVYVAKQYTDWKANTIYTYVFRITDKVPGTTGDDPEPPGPDPTDPALFPIVFDNITVDAYTPDSEEHEWDVNPEGDKSNPHTPGSH